MVPASPGSWEKLGRGGILPLNPRDSRVPRFLGGERPPLGMIRTVAEDPDQGQNEVLHRGKRGTLGMVRLSSLHADPRNLAGDAATGGNI